MQTHIYVRKTHLQTNTSKAKLKLLSACFSLDKLIIEFVDEPLLKKTKKTKLELRQERWESL